MVLKWGKKKVLAYQQEIVDTWHLTRKTFLDDVDNEDKFARARAKGALKQKSWQEENAPLPYDPDQVEILGVEFDQGGEFQIGDMTWDYVSSGYIIKYKIRLEDGKYKKFPYYSGYGRGSSNKTIGELKVEAEDFTSIVNELVELTIEELADETH